MQTVWQIKGNCGRKKCAAYNAESRVAFVWVFLYVNLSLKLQLNYMELKVTLLRCCIHSKENYARAEEEEPACYLIFCCNDDDILKIDMSTRILLWFDGSLCAYVYNFPYLTLVLNPCDSVTTHFYCMKKPCHLAISLVFFRRRKAVWSGTWLEQHKVESFLAELSL